MRARCVRVGVGNGAAGEGRGADIGVAGGESPEHEDDVWVVGRWPVSAKYGSATIDPKSHD